MARKAQRIDAKRLPAVFKLLVELLLRLPELKS